MKRKCSRCRKIADISDFLIKNNHSEKRLSRCKKCTIHGRNYRSPNRKKGNYKQNISKRYYDKNPWASSFHHAKQRCTNPNSDNYKSYGAKGVKFLLTMEDAQHMWYRDNADLMDSPHLDRINTKGNYELNNCQFLDSHFHVKKTVREMKANIEFHRECGRKGARKSELLRKQREK